MFSCGHIVPSLILNIVSARQHNSGGKQLEHDDKLVRECLGLHRGKHGPTYICTSVLLFLSFCVFLVDVFACMTVCVCIELYVLLPLWWNKTYNRTLVHDYPGRLVPEETLTQSHPSCSSDIHYQPPPFTMIALIHSMTHPLSSVYVLDSLL